MRDTATAIEVRPATAGRWDDLVDLFERPGPRGGRQDTGNCWCAVWREGRRTTEGRKEALCERVTGGEEPGLLAYRGDEPVGWVSVAPRTGFPGLLRSTQFGPRDADDGVWVISCFHVDRAHRKQGVARSLLSAAVSHATAGGATAIEAFPADPPDYKGRLAWFLDAGFAPVRTAGKRTVVRLNV